MQQTTCRMLSASNAGWGKLALTLNCSMCRPLTVPADIPRCATDMGKYVAMGAHDCDGRRNLDQQIDHQQHPCRSHGWVLHLGTVPKLMFGCVCCQQVAGE
jgi:hypothetical protein